MNFFYKIYVFIRIIFEYYMDMIRNVTRFIGFGPKKFNNYPETLKGKVVVITGSNTGIGKVTARVLAQLNAKVIMACRDTSKAHIAANDIKKEFKEANIVIRKLDLSSLASVRQFSREVSAGETKIDYLINNAGIMFCPKWQTEDGFEMQFGTNHLGHFLLTNLLIRKLKNSSNPRIITLSSVAHIRGEINFEDINLDKNYNKYKAYYNSKLANVLFTRELAVRLSDTNIKAYCVHPGLINTGIWKHLDGPIGGVFKLFKGITNIDPELGAQTTLYCTLEPSISEETGHYYKYCRREDNMVANAVDDESARKLWELSCELVDIEDNNQL